MTCPHCNQPIQTFVEESDPPRCDAHGAECDCAYVSGQSSEDIAVRELERRVEMVVRREYFLRPIEFERARTSDGIADHYENCRREANAWRQRKQEAIKAGAQLGLLTTLDELIHDAGNTGD